MSAFVWNSGSAANTAPDSSIVHGHGDHPGVGDLVAVRARRELRACRWCRRCAGSSRGRRPAAPRRRGRPPALRRASAPRYATVAPATGSSSGAGCRGAVGRSARSERAPVSAAIRRASDQTRASSSGPAATITFAPDRRTSSAAWPAASAGLMGAAIPTASAARSAVIISLQLTDRIATASRRPTPRPAYTDAARWTSSASSANVRVAGRSQRSASGRQEIAGRCGQSSAARTSAW